MASLKVSSAAQSCSTESISIAFASALSDFKAGLLEDSLDVFEASASLPDLKTAIAEVEKEQSKRKSFRNMGKIRPLIDALENYSKVVEVFVNAKPDVLAFIWGPIKLCVQVYYCPSYVALANTESCRSVPISSKPLMPFSMPMQDSVPPCRLSESLKIDSARIFLFKMFWSMFIRIF